MVVIKDDNNIDIKWFYCHKIDQNCNYKCKNKFDVKRHKANIHNIGVTWHKCDIDNKL